jgi:putative colanic acid biosynthesis UDP-glucose lipid carrier transferase
MTDVMLRAGEVSVEPGLAVPDHSLLYDRGTSGEHFIAAASLRFIDAVLIAAAALIVFRMGAWDIARPDMFCLEVVVMALLTGMYFEGAGIYARLPLGSSFAQLVRFTAVYAAAASTVLLINGIVGDWSVELHTLVWLLLAFVMLAFSRLVETGLFQRLRRSGKLATSVVVVGSHAPLERLRPYLSSPTVTIASILDLDDRRCSDVTETLMQIARTRSIDEVLVPLPWTCATPLDAFLRALRNLSITVRLLPELPCTSFPCLHVAALSGLPTISVIERPLSDRQVALKRVEDVVISSVALMIAAPIMALIALVIRLESPGPVLFRQERWGFNARPISVLKFRTMRVHDDPVVTQATRDDPRVTHLGRILRRTSLDELPQLINVLRGDMSLVGPRPHAVAHNERYAPLINNYLARHRVKPGITGLAQVNGCRGITDTIEKMERRVAYDLRYIEHWSLLLDMKVLFKTIWVGFISKNAF